MIFSKKGVLFYWKWKFKTIVGCFKMCFRKNDVVEDKQKIKYLCRELEKIENQIPSYDKLEELQKIVIDLEVIYDDFNDLSYYFNPLYVEIKNIIHTEEVKKIREENKRKRDLN